MQRMIHFFTLLTLVLQAGCSMDVPKATVPSDPPKAEKANFSVQDISGQYKQSGLPKMFLWPIDRWDSKKQKYVPMTFDEKVVARQKITAYADDVALYEGEADDLQRALDTKFDNLEVDLKDEYLGNKCYALCLPDGGILCLPDVPNLDTIAEGEWKEPETPEEEELILSCQANQKRRKTLADEKKAEKALTVDLVLEKAGDAGLALLEEVGNRNYFVEMTRFEFTYGRVSCFATTELCEQGGEGAQLFINLKYGDHSISNFLQNASTLKTSNINLDTVDGFLVFKIPAIDLEKDNEVYGEITFDLEFVKSGDRMNVNGDFRVFYFATKEEKIGRFASSGKVTQPE